MFHILTYAALLTIISAPALAESVTEKLGARKQASITKASPEKRQANADSFRQIKNSGVLERAVNVGDIAPDFTLPSAVETQVTLSELLKDGPVVMTWYRGEWCPYCNIYLEDLQKHAADFQKFGAQIVAISPEKIDKSMQLADRKALKYNVLSDEGSKIAKEYGVVYTLPPHTAEKYQKAFNLHEHNNDDRNLLPIAASYVIAQDGTITYAYLNVDYRDRAETMILLEEVKKLKQKAADIK